MSPPSPTTKAAAAAAAAAAPAATSLSFPPLSPSDLGNACPRLGLPADAVAPPPRGASGDGGGGGGGLGLATALVTPTWEEHRERRARPKATAEARDVDVLRSKTESGCRRSRCWLSLRGRRDPIFCGIKLFFTNLSSFLSLPGLCSCLSPLPGAMVAPRVGLHPPPDLPPKTARSYPRPAVAWAARGRAALDRFDMVEVRDQSLGGYSGSKSRRSGGVRSGLRCLLLPCLTFAAVCGVSNLVRWKLFGAAG